MLYDRIAQTPLRTPAHGAALQTPLGRTHSKPVASVDPDGLIYGTTILIRKALESIEKFLLDFEQTHEVNGQIISEQLYRSRLNELDNLDDVTIFEVEGKHIRQFDKELYLQLVYHPAEMISCFDSVIRYLFERHFIEPETNPSTRSKQQARMSTLLMGLKGLHEDELLCVKELGPKSIGRLVMVRAIVVRVSEVIPQMKRALFRCENCGDELGVDMINARVQEPDKCRVCNRKDTLQILHNLCSFTDKQYLKLQELPELVTEGETPSSLTVIAYDGNVDGFRPGDRLELIGIFRAQPGQVDRYKGTLRTLFNTYLDLISFNPLNQQRLGQPRNTIFSDHQKLRFLQFADGPDVLGRLVSSFAPSIFGHDLVKKGILTQLFGGTRKTVPGRGQTRSDINICLIGDPSTAKSQFLQQVHRIAPRSVYTSGRGSSAVGLTAHVRRDPQTRQFMLQSGALVLADQGICCIDQFDKMEENSRTVLLEAMQQQTVSIAKAGIVCQLNSRTAILAAANPIHSKYDPKKSVMENVNLQPSLVSRFDLLYILLDIADEVADTRLAQHILDFYVHGHMQVPHQGPLSLPELTKYITYAREQVNPFLSRAAGEKLVREYKSLRAKGLSKKTITATPRQLESLIRLSQAFARMRLSNEVNEEDVEESVTLMQKATLSTATDPQTGIIDLDIITTGRSSALKQRVQKLAHKLREFLLANEAKYRKPTTLQRLLGEFSGVEGVGVGREELMEGLKVLQSDELLVLFGQNKNNPHFKLQHSSE